MTASWKSPMCRFWPTNLKGAWRKSSEQTGPSRIRRNNSDEHFPRPFTISDTLPCPGAPLGFGAVGPWESEPSSLGRLSAQRGSHPIRTPTEFDGNRPPARDVADRLQDRGRTAAPGNSRPAAVESGGG